MIFYHFFVIFCYFVLFYIKCGMETENGIKKFRERLRIKTQSALAAILEIEQTTISNWEKGQLPKNFDAIRKLFEMGITVEELFDFPYNEKRNLIEAKPEPKPEPEPATGGDTNLILKKLKEMQAEINELKSSQKQLLRQDAPPPVAKTG